MGDYRARRIEAVLGEAPCDLDTFRRLHVDSLSLQAQEMMVLLGPWVSDTELGRKLAGWDCHYDLDSTGAVLFERFYRELLIELFAPSGSGGSGLGGTGFGDTVINHLLDVTGIFIDFYANFDALLTSPTSAWLGERTLESVYRAAFARVQDDGQTWGETNRVMFTNILMGGKLPDWSGFDVGPISLRGGRATPHQGQIYSSGGRQTSFAPSLRLMADLGEDVLHTSLAGGPSDRRWSSWYTSDLERWQRGEYKLLGRRIVGAGIS